MKKLELSQANKQRKTFKELKIDLHKLLAADHWAAIINFLLLSLPSAIWVIKRKKFPVVWFKIIELKFDNVEHKFPDYFELETRLESCCKQESW